MRNTSSAAFAFLAALASLTVSGCGTSVSPYGTETRVEQTGPRELTLQEKIDIARRESRMGR